MARKCKDRGHDVMYTKKTVWISAMDEEDRIDMISVLYDTVSHHITSRHVYAPIIVQCVINDLQNILSLLQITFNSMYRPVYCNVMLF